MPEAIGEIIQETTISETPSNHGKLPHPMLTVPLL